MTEIQKKMIEQAKPKFIPFKVVKQYEHLTREMLSLG